MFTRSQTLRRLRCSEKVVIDMITVCLNKYDGQDEQALLTRCEEAKIRLKTLTSFQDISESKFEIEVLLNCRKYQMTTNIYLLRPN